MAGTAKEYSHDEVVVLYDNYIAQFMEFEKKGQLLQTRVQRLMDVWRGQAATRFDDKADEWLTYYRQSNEKFKTLTEQLGTSIGIMSELD